MLPTLASSLCLAAHNTLLAQAPAAWALLAQAVAGGEEERTYVLEVLIIMLCLILGLMVTIRPTKRKDEVKKPAEG